MTAAQPDAFQPPTTRLPGVQHVIAVGAAVGGLARSKLAATIAVAAGMLTGLAIEGVFAEWVRAGALGGAVRIAAALAIYAGLGALGGLAGKRLALRRAAR